MKRANGFFEAFVNERAYRTNAEDRALAAQITAVVQATVVGGQVRWAGSQRKGTAVVGSDLDLCVESSEIITERQRRELRALLEKELTRPAVIQSHVVRLPAVEGRAKVDLAFTNAAFGSRPLPDTDAFHDNRARQASARAMKLWARGVRLPPLPGWVIEALVVHLDHGDADRLPIELFLRVITWLEERATVASLEGVLRPAAHPRWEPAWSERLPGRLEAVRNQAKALRGREPKPDAWRSVAEVGIWLSQ